MLLVTLLVRDDEGNGAKSAGEKHSFLPLRCLEVGPWVSSKRSYTVQVYEVWY